MDEHKDVFDRWERRFPEAAARNRDPRGRSGGICRECGTTFAWFGYDGLCGWCYEDAHRPKLRLVSKVADPS